MKKLLVAIALTLTMVTATTLQTKADGAYYNGKNVQLKFPRGVDSNRVYLYPTYKFRDLAYDDTLAVSVTDLETYVVGDTLTSNVLVNITRNSYVLPGAKLYLKLASNATDTLRQVIVKDGATVVDTFYAGRQAYREYFYNGYTFQKVSNASASQLIGAVTQASSITTAVTLNAPEGIITTVSSTIAADDSSASFTFTNSFIKATSHFTFTIEYGGNGIPHPQVTSKTAGSAVIRLYNVHRTAALNNTVKIHYTIKE